MSKPHIGCPLLRLTYDFYLNACNLYLPAGACTDMTAAIEFVQSRFPDVASIFTFSGNTADTVYTKFGGEWSADQFQAS